MDARHNRSQMRSCPNTILISLRCHAFGCFDNLTLVHHNRTNLLASENSWFITRFPIRRSGALQQTFYGSPPTCPVLGFSPPCEWKAYHCNCRSSLTQSTHYFWLLASSLPEPSICPSSILRGSRLIRHSSQVAQPSHPPMAGNV